MRAKQSARKEKKIECKERERLRKKSINEPTNKRVVVNLYESKEIDVKGNISIAVLVLDQKYKTKSVKNAQFVEWNQEFQFDLIGLDLNTDVEVVVYSGHHFIGEVVMPLHVAKNMGEGQTWYPLDSNDTETNEPVKSSGELCLEFKFNF